MANRTEVVSVNVSEGKGTAKWPVPRIHIDSRGVVGDAHRGLGSRQVSLLSQELIDEFVRSVDRPTKPGAFAENITLRGLDLRQVAPLDRFRIGAVELEVTQIGKECHGDTCAIFREVGQCIMPKEGVFCRVVREGGVEPGDEAAYQPRVLQVWVATLSDRAAAGEYEDRSGPRVRELVESFFVGTRWRVETKGVILPDDPERLRAWLESARSAGADIILTTGSTGVGPRDIAPETVAPLCDKLIPGIMEHIRAKFGANKPNALLSRGVAGVMGTAQVYTLPGSVRAVEEYLGEILKTVEHLIYMLHGIDRH